jgi:copper homeostasis protein
MVRPRGGSFVYSDIEIGHMRHDIEMALDLGVAAVVLGVLDSSNRIDAGRSASLIEVAGASRVTFHRAFDRTPDLLAAIDTLLSLGVARVLTSGGAPTALEGVEVLASLVDRAADRLQILAGGGVRPDNVRTIVQRSGVREVHARCERDATRIRAIKDALLVS